jgi:hypothetical protein
MNNIEGEQPHCHFTISTLLHARVLHLFCCEQVKDYISKKDVLPKPAACPDWLFDLITWCRHDDPSQRPTIEKVKEVLDEHKTYVYRNCG